MCVDFENCTYYFYLCIFICTTCRRKGREKVMYCIHVVSVWSKETTPLLHIEARLGAEHKRWIVKTAVASHLWYATEGAIIKWNGRKCLWVHGYWVIWVSLISYQLKGNECSLQIPYHIFALLSIATDCTFLC